MANLKFYLQYRYGGGSKVFGVLMCSILKRLLYYASQKQLSSLLM